MKASGVFKFVRWHSVFGVITLFFLFVSTVQANSDLIGKVVSAGGKPVAGAKVVAQTGADRDSLLLAEQSGQEGKIESETVTDAEGRFRLTSLPKTAFSIEVTASGHSRTVVADFQAGEAGEIGVIRLVAASPLSGKVLDEVGKPVAGATIEVSRLGQLRDIGQPMVKVKSDLAGEFNALDAPIGATHVVARASGFLTFTIGGNGDLIAAPLTIRLTRGGTVTGQVLDVDGKPAADALVIVNTGAVKTRQDGWFELSGVEIGNATIEVVRGDLVGRKNVNVAKRKVAKVEIRLAPAATVEGHVIDSKTRQPIVGAAVRKLDALTSGGAVILWREPNLSETAVTDEKGRFRLTGLYPGMVSLFTTKRGYVPSPFHPTELRSGETIGINLSLDPMTKVSGRVVDESDKPVAGVTVSLGSSRNLQDFNLRVSSSSSATGISSITDSTGTFTIFAPAQMGAISLIARAPDYTPAQQNGLQLKMGEEFSGALLRLARGVEARGIVTDDGGKSIKGARVVASRTDGGGISGFADEEPQIVTDTAGTFVIRGLEAGIYRLEAHHPQYASNIVYELEIKAGRTIEVPRLKLKPAVIISGTLRDESGQPIVDASVFANGDSGFDDNVRTDGEGRFTLTKFSAGTKVSINVLASGYNYIDKIVVAPNADANLVLSKNGILQGRVEDADTKAAIRDFRIMQVSWQPAQPSNQYPIFESVSFHASDGRFEWASLSSGKWIFSATAPGYQSVAVANIEINNGKTEKEVVFSLKKGVELRGCIVDASSGAPIKNAEVSYFETWNLKDSGLNSDEGFAKIRVTDMEGRFRLDGLPQKKLSVFVREPSYVEAKREVTIGDEKDIEIKLQAGALIMGTVARSDGRTPAAGVEVRLQSAGVSNRFEDLYAVTTDSSGAFGFERLKAGRYQLVAKGNDGESLPVPIALDAGERGSNLVLVLKDKQKE